jgi:hypothetical protein
MLVDPGTFAYHTEAVWRAYFRGTAAHNTVRIDGQDQSQPGGNFMWLRKANAGCSAWEPGVDEDRFEGWHDGYMALDDPVMHRRRIALDKRARAITLEDTLSMKGEHDVEIFLHCAENSHVRPVEGDFEVRRGAHALWIRWPELAGGRAEVLHGSVDPIGGWVSRRFDRKVAAPTLVWCARVAGDCVLRTRIAIR